MSKGGCENKSTLFIIFIQKIHNIPTYRVSKTIESGEGGISLWIKCFLQLMLATIIIDTQ